MLRIDDPDTLDRGRVIAPRHPVWIDLSRLIWRARHSTPSGIDRVELAYARHFLAAPGAHSRFVARVSALGGREFSKEAIERFVDALERDWAQSGETGSSKAIGRLLASSRRAPDPGRATTIIPSHQNWHRIDWLRQRRGKQGRLILFLHDAIPSEYPEYARAGGGAKHEARLGNALSTADGFIVNSQVTAQALERFAEDRGMVAPPIAVAPLGTRQTEPSQPTSDPTQPYFLTIGTIEPRKNHMLLLLLWRQMVEAGIKPLPKLIIAGRRGWENEQIVDLLERSRALQDVVEERNDLGDGELASLIAGARAVLMPSFTEGYGMPVTEALSSGTPVIASDLPVYREVAGDIPHYCDPLDGPAWRKAILDFAAPDSALRAFQLGKLKGWQAPTWHEHFATVEALQDALA